MWRFRADSSYEEQVAEREQGEQMCPFLGQAAKPRFHVTELALDDPEGMFDLGTEHGDDPIDFLVDGVELAALGRLAYDAPDLAILAEGCLAFSGDIDLVGPNRFLLAVEKFIPDPAVMNLRSRGLEAVDGTTVYVDTNIGFDAKIPIVTFLDRRQLGIPLLGLVLGHGRRVDNRGIHQRARAQCDLWVS